MAREGSKLAMEAALLGASAGCGRYALVNRPACFASLPQGLKYRVDDRPAEGCPHHEYARHGVLVSSRTLTCQEMREFELAFMLNEDHSGEVARVLVEESLAGRAQDYLDAYEDDSSLVKQAVMQEAEGLFDGLRVSFENIDGFVEQVLSRVRRVAGGLVIEA